MTPLEAYQKDIAEGHIKADPAQEAVMKKLDTLAQYCVQHQGLFFRLKTGLNKRSLARGLYIWGEVGGGKTYLMDIFYEYLPIKHKKRIHYHALMQEIHATLTAHQGQADPLKQIIKRWQKKIHVLCIDEFFVKDIGDAMILSGLLHAFFEAGMILVMTSNMPPERLYEHGLQRARFLPAITLINTEMTVLSLHTAVDYRQRHLSGHESYFYPLDPASDAELCRWYQRLSADHIPQPGTLTVLGRDLAYLGRHADLIWFDFSVLCHMPRSQLDYNEIADAFQVVIVSHLPFISAEDRNTLLYLVHMIDVFYDRRVKLILSAAGRFDDIYPSSGPMAEVFQRTRSRINEMQSAYYWHQERND